MVTDTQVHLIPIQVPAANIQDTIVGCDVFEEIIKKYRALKGVCADARDLQTAKVYSMLQSAMNLQAEQKRAWKTGLTLKNFIDSSDPVFNCYRVFSH